MKKLIITGSVLALAIVAVPTVSAHAGPYDYVPPCVVGVGPNYDVAGAGCDEYTNPVTGEKYPARFVVVHLP